MKSSSRGGSLTEPVSSGVVELAFAYDSIDFAEIRPGQQVWKTDDPELTNRLRKSYTGHDPLRRTAVDLVVRATIGQPLQIEATTESGVRCTLAASQACDEARKHPLTEETLRELFGRLGGTPFVLRNLTAQIDSRPMLPFSVLGELRHELVRRLEELSVAPPQRRIADEHVLPRLREGVGSLWRQTTDQMECASTPKTPDPAVVAPPQLHILCRSLPQLREVLAAGELSISADFQDIREFREAVAVAHEHKATILLATPRIQKPDEMGIFHALSKHGADGILVRNLGGLAFFHERQIPVVADFSLNCANELTAQYLREQGSQRITPSYDLNREQLLELVGAVPPAWLEIVVHQHMPLFHMEHCVFCAVLSPGTNKTNCGRPCDTHVVKLRDRIGMEHPLVADVGCRNTLFNAVPQSAAEVVPQLLSAGVRHFRVELLDTTGPALTDLLSLYRGLLTGGVSGHEVWTRLRATNRVGVTRGTLEERRNPLAIV